MLAYQLSLAESNILEPNYHKGESHETETAVISLEEIVRHIFSVETHINWEPNTSVLSRDRFISILQRFAIFKLHGNSK